MPIRPENRAKYLPRPEWLAIVERVRERSGNRCEGTPAFPDCRAENGQPHPVTGSKVVLTVMHLNHDPTDNRMENLKHGCQRCHNTYDAPFRARNRRKNRGEPELALTGGRCMETAKRHRLFKAWTRAGRPGTFLEWAHGRAAA